MECDVGAAGAVACCRGQAPTEEVAAGGEAACAKRSRPVTRTVDPRQMKSFRKALVDRPVLADDRVISDLVWHLVKAPR
jgi:hypothetical protein